MKLSKAQLTVLDRISSLPNGKPIDRAPKINFTTAAALADRGLATLTLSNSGYCLAITDEGLAELETNR